MDGKKPDEVSVEYVSLSDFKKLLNEDEFIDFFNKFTCLPAFKQLVLYNKGKQEYYFEPDLPKHQYVLNASGLNEWLWRKRYLLFVETKMFLEYLLAKNLLNHNLFRNDIQNLRQSEQAGIHESLLWLFRVCFSRVSGIRNFRRFLQKTDHGYKMYSFWLEAERLYLNMKRKSVGCLEKLNSIKQTFFLGSGDLTFPKHIMDLVWENIPEPDRDHAGGGGDHSISRHYGITFTMCMQQLCLHRLQNYWVPRYLFSLKLKPKTLSDKVKYEVAMRYLHGRPPYNMDVLKHAILRWQTGIVGFSTSSSDESFETSRDEMLGPKAYDLNTEQNKAQLREKLKRIANINRDRRSLAVYADSHSSLSFVTLTSGDNFSSDQEANNHQDTYSFPEIARLFLGQRDSNELEYMDGNSYGSIDTENEESEFSEPNRNDFDKMLEYRKNTGAFVGNDTNNLKTIGSDKTENNSIEDETQYFEESILPDVLEDKIIEHPNKTLDKAEDAKEDKKYGNHDDADDDDDDDDDDDFKIFDGYLDPKKRRDSLAARTLRFQEVLHKTSVRKASIMEEHELHKIKERQKNKTFEQTINVDEGTATSPRQSVDLTALHDHAKVSRATQLMKEALQANHGKLLKHPKHLPDTGHVGSHKQRNTWPTEKMNKENLPGEDSDIKISSDTTLPEIKQKILAARLMSSKISDSSEMSPHRKGSQDGAESMSGGSKAKTTSSKPKPKKAKITTLTFTISGAGSHIRPRVDTEVLQCGEKSPKPKDQQKKETKEETKRKSIGGSKDNKTTNKLSTDGNPDGNTGGYTSGYTGEYTVSYIDENGIVQKEEFMTSYTFEQDHAYRHDPENKRMIEALQTDHAAGTPYQRYLVTTGNEKMVDYLHFWQDIEKSRRDYTFGTMEFQSFMNSMSLIVSNYLLPSSNYQIVVQEHLRQSVVDELLSPESIDMPWQLRRLQAEVMERLRDSYQAYCTQDIRTFRNLSSFKLNDEKYEVRPGGHRIDVCPFVKKRVGGIKLSPMKLQDITNENDNSSNEFKKELELRMRRSQQLVLEIHLPSGRTFVELNELKEEDIADDFSDDEGHVKTPNPPKVVRVSEIDPKTLASMSVKEYPLKGPQENYTLVRTIERRIQRFSANYFKPIKKGGRILQRPTTRPGSFQELLKDAVHFEFFKRYLKVHRSEAPIMFWLAVESLRVTDQMKKRQQRAKSIIRKYFQNSKVSAIKLLQCNADIIKEIPYLDIVTTSMLIIAQTAVVKALELSWYKKYLNTFPVGLTAKTSVNSDFCLYNGKSTRRTSSATSLMQTKAWGVLKQVFKRASIFLRCMKQEKFVKLFREFLKKQAIMDEKSSRSTIGETPQSDDFRKLNTNRKRTPEAEKDGKKLKYRLLNGELVIYNLLANDLRFWQEITCYRTIADSCLLTDEYVSASRVDENKMLKKKATLIVKCFLESSIPPEIRVNVPVEVCEITVESLHNGMLDRALFHEATIYIFPLLLLFWKKFCLQYYKYTPVLSEKHRRIYGDKMNPRLKMQAQEKRKQSRDQEKRPSIDSSASTISPSSEYAFPDYLNMKSEDFIKRRGSPSADSFNPRLSFSISQGVRVILPHKVRKLTAVRAMGSAQDVRFVLHSQASSSEDSIHENTLKNRLSKKPGMARLYMRRNAVADVSVIEDYFGTAIIQKFA